MLSLAVYKTIHFLGIFTLVTALTATLARSAQSGASSGAAPAGASGGAALPDPWRKRLGIAHGAALFLILLAGFGMLAKLDVGFPGWAMAKVGIWLVAGGLIALRKKPSAAAWGVVVVPLLAALAGSIAYVKPF